ncbi:unnamed protein product [Rotaria sp. Silwood2]|nr:unnamed protein product [Rotaria sp. Silwood2]CAF2926503.1 unnamed protein product [Rotaria sp. Silwood2]CAF4495841.1 unnamed protein product [Rotaria sp. Silwood2]CAF4499695.1 unnamed protein product [Rotaria sp. Silwood2]
MKRNSYQLTSASGKRQSNALSVFVVAPQKNGRRMSMFMNAQRRSSLISQISLPHSAEYHPQQRLPPNGLEYQQNILLTNITTAIKDNPTLVQFKSTKKANSSKNLPSAHTSDVVDHEQKPGDDENSLGS